MDRAFDWRKIYGVIFDIDGTLYSQKTMRFKMSVQLLRHYLLRPHKINDILILSRYRKIREMLADNKDKDFYEKQFSMVAGEFNTSEEYVKDLVDDWILDKPLKYINDCRFPEIIDFINALHRNNIKTAALSDYPAGKKLHALKLPIKIFLDENFCLKPDPSGLIKLLFSMKIEPSECLFIGDRHDRDGACAGAVGMPYLIKGRKNRPDEFSSYMDLKNEVENCYART